MRVLVRKEEGDALLIKRMVVTSNIFKIEFEIPIIIIH
jgi:hypothetical protein